MAKKDFTKANTTNVYNAIKEATAEPEHETLTVQAEPEEQQTQEVKNPRKPYSAKKAHEMQEAGTTQGRKGCKQVRINMAFTPEVHDYIRTMARVSGQSVTVFTNKMFKEHMEAHKALYEMAKNFKNQL